MQRCDFKTLREYIEAKRQEAESLGYSSFEGLQTFIGKIVPKGKLAFDFDYDVKQFCFEQLDEISSDSGLYQIFTFEGVPLKVGIAKNLRKRLKQHFQSKQSRLKVMTEGEVSEPSHLQSKQSILAKHLYFDTALTKAFNLKSEQGRHDFLKQETYLLITVTSNIEEARRLEKIAESSDMWRYKGRVKIINF